MDPNSEKETAFRLEDVRKSFPRKTTALDSVSLRLVPGELTGLIGANGSGKSTLLRAIAGELAIDSGEIRTWDRTPYPPSRELRRRVSLIHQEPALDPEMTTLETLRLFGALHGLSRADIRSRIEELATRFGLESELAKRTGQLSGGFRQRLHLATGLIHRPGLILADEPSSALDPESSRMTWENFSALARSGAAVFVASHDLAEVERHCQRIVMLADGAIVADGSPQELVADHGATALEAEVDETTDIGELSRLPGVERVEKRGNRLTLLLEETAVESVLEALAPVRAYRCEQPNLASAYLTLSGKTLDKPATSGGGRGGGRKRKGGKRQ